MALFNVSSDTINKYIKLTRKKKDVDKILTMLSMPLLQNAIKHCINLKWNIYPYLHISLKQNYFWSILYYL